MFTVISHDGNSDHHDWSEFKNEDELRDALVGGAFRDTIVDAIFDPAHEDVTGNYSEMIEL